MCLPLVARIVAVAGEEGEVELLGGGGRARVELTLFPEVGVGQHVLVDRGLVIETIDAREAEEMLAFYAELAGAEDEWEATEAADAADFMREPTINAPRAGEPKIEVSDD